MPTYKAPIRDLQFVLHEVLKAEEHYQSIGAEEATTDMVDAILSEARKIL